MLETLKQALQKEDAFSHDVYPVIDMICDTIPSKTIHPKMKLTIALSELTLFASQFRRNIAHWDGGEVPINSIGFIVSGSGSGKDSAVNAARKSFNIGYEMINDYRKRLAKEAAIKEARDSGDENPTAWETYKSYYRAPNPLFVSPSTSEGFIQHLNDIDQDKIGAGFIYSGEIGAELSQNPLMVENIKLLSELYDLGNKEVKVLKARENQSKEIKNLPVSALFVGSPANLLYDEAIKRKFKVEFSTKLARRSWFCFCPEEIPAEDFSHCDDPITAMLDAEVAAEDAAMDMRNTLSKGIAVLTKENLNNRTALPVDVDVRRLFLVYKRYNSEVADNISKLYPMSVIVRRHLQWKALKLAGAIAIFEQHDSITKDDYLYAIRLCEILDSDMAAFESELVKEPYEVFADYMKSIAKDGKSCIGLHNLRKLNYIPTGSGNPLTKMKDLVHLAAAYDPNAVYKVCGDEICYEAIVKTDTLYLSSCPIDNSGVFAAVESGNKTQLTKAKEIVSYTVAKEGFTTSEETFADLANMLLTDTAYSNFVFKNGVRGHDNIIGGTKWMILDVDTSRITATEAHFLLQDINHHIALSSDAQNEFKFRVLIELDSVVTLDSNVWRHFVTIVANDLSLQVDLLAQSAIFYSYSGRPIYSVTDAEPLAVRDYIMQANDKASETTPVREKALTTPQKQALIDDELTTFSRAFDAPPGAGSREMMKAAYYGRDLGMSKEDIIALVTRINEYWVNPMDEERFQNTIIKQIMRF